MTGYSLLEIAVTDDDVFVTSYDAPEPLDEHAIDAVPIADVGRACLYYHGSAQRKLDYVAGVQPFPVISSRFRELLTEANVSGLEYHPATLICADNGEKDDTYSVLNLLVKVEAFDWDRAEFEVFTGSDKAISWIEKLAIREEALDDHDLVRLAEMTPIILVSERLRTLIEEAGLTGVGFTAIEDFGEL